VCLRGSSSDTAVGFTVGGGFEWGLTERLSLKGEYLFVDLGNENVRARPGLSTPNAFLEAETNFELQVARVGLNYRFGAGSEAESAALK
jgi:outer membrane immunogenic protein